MSIYYKRIYDNLSFTKLSMKPTNKSYKAKTAFISNDLL